jgi:hypothetical protein
LPRAGKKYDQLKSLAEDYDTTEFMITNNERVFGGNAVQLMAVYKAEQIPIRVRLYAVSKSAEFELASGGGYQETFGEDYGERLLQKITELRQSMPPAERVHDVLEKAFAERGELADLEFIDEVVAMVEERLPTDRRIDEILPPPLGPALRKRPSEVIDGEVVQHGCDTASEVIEKPSLSSGTTDMHSVDQPVAKPPAPRIWDDTARAFEQSADSDAIEVAIPTRGPNGAMRYVTKLVPRQ